LFEGLSSSKPRGDWTDYSLVSNTNLSQKMACWVGAQNPVTSAKKSKHTAIMTSPTKDQNQKLSNFVKNLNYKSPAPLEDFSSSLAQSAGELW